MVDYKQTLTRLNENLQILREREAKYGGNAPVDLLNQIDDHEQAIALTEQALEGKLTEAEWQAALQPLTIYQQPPPGLERKNYKLMVVGALIVAGLAIVLALVILLNERGLLTSIGFLPTASATPASTSTATPTSTPTPTSTSTSTSTPSPTPTAVPAGFNIGVAHFDNQTPAVSTEEALTLSTWVYDTLEGQTGAELSRDVPHYFLGPNDVGQVHNDFEAAQVVDALNLTLLVYGVITPAMSGGVEFQPNLFIPETNDTFDYGREASGPNRLGSPITVTLPLDGAALAATNSPLQKRITALGHIILGLNDFSIDRYAEAGADFSRALKDDLWPNDSGKEVAYLLQGAAALQSSGQSRCNPLDKVSNLEKAQAAFTNAQKINPYYARSYLGLGAVYLQQAQVYSGSYLYGIEDEPLRQAQQAYSMSLQMADQPQLAYVPPKAEYGLGQTHMLGYFANRPPWSGDEAEAYFRNVIDARNLQQAQPLEWFVGNAYGNICAIELWKLGWRHDSGEKITPESWQNATSDCQHAIDILQHIPRSRPYLADFWRLIGFARGRQGLKAEACAAYSEAITVGNTYPDFCWPVSVWQEEKQRVGCD